MRAETGSSRPSVWDDRPRIDKAGQNRRSDGWKETRAEVQDLHDRVLIVEQSLKSYHKRLDGMNLNIKTDQ